MMSFIHAVCGVICSLVTENTDFAKEVRIILKQSQKASGCAVRMAASSLPSFHGLLGYAEASGKKTLRHFGGMAQCFDLFGVKIRNINDLQCIHDGAASIASCQSLCICQCFCKSAHGSILQFQCFNHRLQFVTLFSSKVFLLRFGEFPLAPIRANCLLMRLQSFFNCVLSKGSE